MNNNFPDFNMYAVIDNGVVIDCGFGYSTESIISPLSKKEYKNSETYKFILCDSEAGQFQIGQKIY